jgi:hypothetical protein
MGMAGLLQEFALNEIGRVLYQDEIYKAFKDFALDLGKIGHDEYYGHGLVILPDPDELDIYKYLLHDIENGEVEPEKEENSIKFYPSWSQSQGEIYYIKDGEKVYMDVKPFIRSGRTFLPIRFVAESLGFNVEWDEETGEVKIIK